MGWDMGHYFSKSCKVEQQYTLHSKQLRHTIKSFLSYIHPSFLIQRFQLVISVKVALPKVKRVAKATTKGVCLPILLWRQECMLWPEDGLFLFCKESGSKSP